MVSTIIIRHTYFKMFYHQNKRNHQPTSPTKTALKEDHLPKTHFNCIEKNGAFRRTCRKQMSCSVRSSLTVHLANNMVQAKVYAFLWRGMKEIKRNWWIRQYRDFRAKCVWRYFRYESIVCWCWKLYWDVDEWITVCSYFCSEDILFDWYIDDWLTLFSLVWTSHYIWSNRIESEFSWI